MNKKKNILIVGSNYYQEIFQNLVDETKEEVDEAIEKFDKALDIAKV